MHFQFQLRLIPIAIVGCVAFALGYGVAEWRHHEYRKQVAVDQHNLLLLMDDTLGMADKSLNYAQGYQATLDACLARLHLPGWHGEANEPQVELDSDVGQRRVREGHSGRFHSQGH
jgi:hypothetical protein